MTRSGDRAQQVREAVARLSAPGSPVPADPVGLATLLVAAYETGETPARSDVALAVRALCEGYGRSRGGRTVELRVPPYAAVQLAADGATGPVHTRGTPPAVVETDPETLLRLAAGSLSWHDAVTSRRVRSSGVHADLASLFG